MVRKIVLVGMLCVLVFAASCSRQNGITTGDNTDVTSGVLVSWGREAVPEPQGGSNNPYDSVDTLMVYAHSDDFGDVTTKILKNSEGLFEKRIALQPGLWEITAEAFAHCAKEMYTDGCPRVFYTTYAHIVTVYVGEIQVVYLEMFQVTTGDLGVQVLAWINAGLFETIQKAIDTAIPNIEGVYIPPGDYNVALSMRRDVPVMGSGFGRTRLFPIPESNSPVVTFPLGANTSLEKLAIVQTLDNAGAVSVYGNASLSQILVLFKSQGITVFPYNTDTLWMANCTLVDTDGGISAGVSYKSSPVGGMIHHNVFVGMSLAVGVMNGSNIVADHNDYWQVENPFLPSSDTDIFMDPLFDSNYRIQEEILINSWIGALVFWFSPDPYGWSF